MRALLSLHGVGSPTASVLLHLAASDGYPAILDQRVLQALGVRGPVTVGFAFWERFVETCRQLAREAEVGGRAFDRGLWQWSKEQGLPLR